MITTALIAEDEPVLAAEIREELKRLWPDLGTWRSLPVELPAPRGS